MYMGAPIKPTEVVTAKKMILTQLLLRNLEGDVTMSKVPEISTAK